MKTYTDDEIVRALEKIANKEIGDCARDCIFYNGKVCNCAGTVAKYSLYFIKRQQAEIEELNECYTNLSNASLQHITDYEKDRQLLGEYQNIFLDLGFGLEILDPELKEIKAWKDRMIWHCKRSDELLIENINLKAEIEKQKKKLQEILLIVAELKSEGGE